MLRDRRIGVVNEPVVLIARCVRVGMVVGGKESAQTIRFSGTAINQQQSIVSRAVNTATDSSEMRYWYQAVVGSRAKLWADVDV